MWILYAVVAGAFLYSLITAPKPQGQPSPTLEDVQFPSAQAGKDIGVLFGCRERRDPNVLWYGDLRTTPIKTKGGKK